MGAFKAIYGFWNSNIVWYGPDHKSKHGAQCLVHTAATQLIQISIQFIETE